MHFFVDLTMIEFWWLSISARKKLPNTSVFRDVRREFEQPGAWDFGAAS
ncbi:MAG TPA: hypothetical protein VFW13_07655 [Phenylobacterium sp.]|nr:hypothetical protein [Phenylobacterium sp.]